MLNVALIGVGGMGRGHLENLIRFTNEGKIIKLVAACDIRPERLQNEKSDFNLDVGKKDIDFSKFNCYTDMDEMFAKEKLDMVLLALPTYLHCEITVKCLKLGYHVFCEKPMAPTVEECDLMLKTAKECGKQLMIGQVLRFWGEYEVLKDIVKNETLGKPLGAYFFRGGDTPIWSYNDWLRKRECGGGALCDQHVHDIDMVQYLYGMPKAVQTAATILYEGSGYDSVSTNYIFDQPIAVNAQDDWALEGYGFSMLFRANFEKGTVYMDHNGFRICPRGGKTYVPEYNKENGYYREIAYFADCIINGSPNTIDPPEESRETIRLMVAETKSADNGGTIVNT